MKELINKIGLKYISFVKSALKAFAVYISICGFFGFSLFIVEEAIQTTMFSTWQANDVRDFATVKQSLDLMEAQIVILRSINSVGGWVNPLAYVSYEAFAKSSEQYVRSVTAKIIAYEPGIYIGKKIEFMFTPPTSSVWTKQPDGLWSTNTGRLNILTSSPLNANIPHCVKGEVYQEGDKIFIKCL